MELISQKNKTKKNYSQIQNGKKLVYKEVKPNFYLFKPA
jgi:hypothetical protein